ncbi:MAG: hypothetical protein HYS17_02740 [Micavibrio aeruginosavorus]|uniref:Uncharacterized protein n=1 Tax=Micavibrio aeruginosavorus TaxID=349221 RepID=A0A7T5UGX2_9BACT|nr:MAG: hypothetical protein HYS17_02740 [Micavibrio aeruginosavorus]
MVSSIQADDAKLAVRLPIHIDVPEHFLTAADYLVAVDSINVCLNELNKRAFEGKLECSLLVFPNEEGSFKGITGVLAKGVKKSGQVIVITGALGGFIGFAETDSFKGLVKGLTKHEVNYYQMGENVGSMLHDMIVGLFTIENEQLEKFIPHDINLDKAIKAKSEFYHMCIKNQRVRGVGFDDSENFPIQRNRFAFHTSKDRVRPVASDFLIYDAVIISPVDVDKDIKWELEDRVTKAPIKAYMRDDAFKKSFLNGEYPLKQSRDDDHMTVLVEYKKQEKNGEVEIKEVSIGTVYSFNDTEIIPIPANLPQNVVFVRPSETPMDKLWGRK